MSRKEHGPVLGQAFTDGLRAMWPTMSATEIAAKTGWHKSLIYKWAKIYGLRHDEETKRRLNTKRVSNIEKSHTPEIYDKIRKARCHNHRMERFRVMSGLPQKTKYHISMVPRRVLFAVSGLCTRRNYYRDPNDPYTLYYDSQTRRCDSKSYYEDYYTRKYGIRFVQGEE